MVESEEPGQLVGLLDADGFLSSLAIFIAREQGKIIVRSRLESLRAAKIVIFGRYSIPRDLRRESKHKEG